MASSNLRSTNTRLTSFVYSVQFSVSFNFGVGSSVPPIFPFLFLFPLSPHSPSPPPSWSSRWVNLPSSAETPPDTPTALGSGEGEEEEDKSLRVRKETIVRGVRIRGVVVSSDGSSSSLSVGNKSRTLPISTKSPAPQPPGFSGARGPSATRSVSFDCSPPSVAALNIAEPKTKKAQAPRAPPQQQQQQQQQQGILRRSKSSSQVPAPSQPRPKSTSLALFARGKK